MPDGSGSPDNSHCKRLRISSLIDMPEEEDIYDLYPSGIRLLHEMRSRSMDTEHWSHLLRTAFDAKDVGALNKVIGHLQKDLAAHPAGPAAAIPSPPVHDVPAPPPGQTRLQQ